MNDLKSVLDIMFNPEELCCPSDSKFAYHSLPVKELLTGKVTLVSSNQKIKIKTVKTEELLFLSINPMKEGYRNDDNVSAFRTFLWEIDIGSLQNQFDYVKKLGIPWSIAVYSGNKSVHFLTILNEDINEKMYRYLYKWALSIGTLFDSNCKNPSRSVRLPDVTRPDTNKKQELLKIKNKVKLEDFISWLNKYEHLRPKEYTKKETSVNEADYNNVSRWAKNQLEKGIDFSKGRNKTWFCLACDLYKSGLIEEDAIQLLLKYFTEESDFKEKEFLMTINSAFKYMEHK